MQSLSLSLLSPPSDPLSFPYACPPSLSLFLSMSSSLCSLYSGASLSAVCLIHFLPSAVLTTQSSLGGSCNRLVASLPVRLAFLGLALPRKRQIGVRPGVREPMITFPFSLHSIKKGRICRGGFVKGPLALAKGGLRGAGDGLFVNTDQIPSHDFN